MIDEPDVSLGNRMGRAESPDKPEADALVRKPDRSDRAIDRRTAPHDAMRNRTMKAHTNMKDMTMNGRMKKNDGVAARIGIVMMALLLSTGFAYAKGGKGEGGKHGDRIAKMIEKLELTEAQKTQIQALRDEFQQENAAALERGKALREQMREQMKSGDKEAAKATREEMKEAMGGLKEARQELHEDILAVLTAEQRAELEAMKEKGKDKMKENGKVKKQKKERKAKKGADDDDEDLD